MPSENSSTVENAGEATPPGVVSSANLERAENFPAGASLLTSHPIGLSRTTESTILRDLIRSLEDAGTSPLLWKATPHSETPLSGSGDTDLLVAPHREKQAREVLEKAGFLRIDPAPWRRQPFVTDWFREDPGKGILLHVQLYADLVLGSAFDPPIEVPGVPALLERRSGSFPPLPHPADAAVLRLCRAALRRPWTPGSPRKKLQEEAQFLVDALEPEALAAAARLFSEGTAGLVPPCFAGASISRLRKSLVRNHRSTERAGGEKLPARITAAVARLNRLSFRLSVLPRRDLPRPAPVIAVIGSDGSGKSTVARRIATLLDEKIDTRFLYFGTGDGPCSWYRAPLVALRKMRESVGSSSSSEESGRTSTSKAGVPGPAKALWATAVALERRGKRNRARRAAANGWVAVTDRYPQAEHPGIHDGPRLHQWTRSRGLRGFLTRRELRVYVDLASTPPDLLLLLDVSADTAIRRRPDEEPEELVRRIEAARALRYGHCPRVVIDADLPLESVIGTALTHVFRALTK